MAGRGVRFGRRRRGADHPLIEPRDSSRARTAVPVPLPADVPAGADVLEIVPLLVCRPRRRPLLLLVRAGVTGAGAAFVG